MKEKIINYLEDKKTILLGFGKEGISSYHFIRSYFPDLQITIADRNTIDVSDIVEDRHVTFVFGSQYDQNLNDFDIILKSPGINLSHINYLIDPKKISSQTDLFLMAYRNQVIGVTGTKGKSTTSSLIYHILNSAGKKVLLAGNIGTPLFDTIHAIDNDTVIVAELSAHQLEYLHYSPHIALFLNCFPEHLDHFTSFNDYQLAKFNILHYQTENDTFIYNRDNIHIANLFHQHHYQRQTYPFSKENAPSDGAFADNKNIYLYENKEVVSTFHLEGLSHLPGKHNFYNIMAAILAVKRYHCSDEDIVKALHSFKPLEHRIEFIGTLQGINFYNDSISTIPEATIAAVNAVKNCDTLILGGFDRGIDYSELIAFLHQSKIRNIAFVGAVGKRILKEWQAYHHGIDKKYIIENDYSKIVAFAFANTQKGATCLLSPAASSYDQFKNFEERGTQFKNLILDFIQ
ncbi:MAG: UDP-N-acetylmuramoyl-L-alanine--D-glutamate ligase [Bacteroidales bacterium]|jgi:UDP-N-acetylmuramoylalanine--D-glutamate ligase|nr:UDP-N-acetylmuramoyl-L-alanine--D-glutamate ligase [Bacteroidales bacterium]